MGYYPKTKRTLAVRGNYQATIHSTGWLLSVSGGDCDISIADSTLRLSFGRRISIEEDGAGDHISRTRRVVKASETLFSNVVRAPTLLDAVDWQ